MYKLDLVKAEEPEIKLPTFIESQKKKETSASLTMLKPFTVWTKTNYGIFLNKCKYDITVPVS